MKIKYALFFIVMELLSASFALQAQTVPTPDHIVVVMMENHGTDLIIGSANAPYINSLLVDTEGAFFSNSYAVTHPSQPNYITLFSGSSQGVLGDLTPFSFQLPFTAPNLGAQLLQSGRTFAGYSEDMPSVGYTSDSYNNYRRRHCPWINWQDATTNGIPAALNLPYTSFPTHYDSLPTLCFVIPNLQNDMHDGSVAMGDTWLRNNIDAYAQWAKTHNSLLIVTWDEDENIIGSSTTIPTIFVGQMVKAGTYTEHIDHNSVLRTIEAMYRLPFAGDAATSNTITDCWIYRPHSALSASAVSICQGQSIVLADSSSNGPMAWQWYFQGGSPALSYSQTPPVVTYSTAGSYDVKLITANHIGFDTLTLPGYITVHSYPTILLNADSINICTGDTATLTATGAGSYTWLAATGIVATQANTLKVAPAVNTTYYVTGSNSGCAGDTTKAAVVVNARLTPTIQISPDSLVQVCQSNSVVFTAITANQGTSPSYQWKVNGANVGSNSATFSAFALSNFTVSCVLTSNAVCATPLTAHSAGTLVDVHAPPVISWLGVGDTIYTGASPVQLSGASPVGGIYTGAGIYANIFYPDSAGAGSHVISYSYTDNIGCSATTSKTFVVLATGINETSVERAIQCYPNPAKGQLTVKGDIFSDRKMRPVVYDATGRVMNVNVARQANGFVFNTSILPAGEYLIRFNSDQDDQTFSKRFIKE